MDARLHKAVMPTSTGTSITVQHFNDLAIQQAVDGALSKLDSNSAILDVNFGPQDGVRAVVAAKLGGHWSVALVGNVKDRKDWNGGARVKFDW